MPSVPYNHSHIAREAQSPAPVRQQKKATETPNVGLEERVTNRVYATLPIRVIGADHTGTSFVEDTTTVCINQKGARISLARSLLHDDVVMIKNMKNGAEAEFHVVGIVQRAFGSRAEWGVELVHPEINIWGTEFLAPPNETLAKVSIECAACKKVAEAKLSPVQYDVLLATGLISRHCDRCCETTRWKPFEQERRESKAAPKSGTAVSAENLRHTRRVKMSFRVRVRSEAGILEITKTRDVSRSGLCFASKQKFRSGERAYVTLPYSEQSTPLEVPVEIRWANDTRDSRIFGACYTRT
jgi:hypothetical protein